jgi:hypothetical protein
VFRIRIRIGSAFDGRPDPDPGGLLKRAKMKGKTQPKDRLLPVDLKSIKKQCVWQSWAFATFSPIRYSLFRYFNNSFRYRYSATFLKIAIRYSLFAIATFVSSVLLTASILGLYLR